MTYVINEPCIGTKDASCVEVCPVDCIHPTPDEPDFDQHEQLYIDPDEYIGELGHIPGSVLIPVAQLSHRLAELQDYRDRQVICICKAGGRAHTAAGILMQAGFPSVVSVAGGMTRWNELQYPTTK